MLPPKPPNEKARLAMLREYEVLDTDPELNFDDLTALAASICEVPVSAITLIDADRQWFKSRVGVEESETPLEFSFCAYAILKPEMMVVEDTTRDERLASNPSVMADDGIRFYAGVPLRTPEGYALGTICVADRVPRQLRPDQTRALESLSRQVQTQLELRRKLRDLRRTSAERDHAQTQSAAKSAEIERDLGFARQFQQALLPHNEDYPLIAPASPASLRLHFHHVYQPTMSLGGDFFDVLKLSEHRAGVFIADVMGHGARSALVTAIIRTLFQELAPQSSDPGEVLRRLNARFCGIVQESGQFLFATACYLVFDTQSAQVSFSCAGHPAPVRANRDRTEVVPLQDERANGPVLGLSDDGAYGTCSQPLEAGDVFLLFTDGLVEAPDDDGEEFGEERLYETVRQNPGSDASHLTQVVVEALDKWKGATPLPDDLCLVAVEVKKDLFESVSTGITVKQPRLI